MPDLVAPKLALLFCGINPGLYSAATRHHFARPGNRFWRALHAAGFSDRVLEPWEEERLLPRGTASPTWWRARPRVPTSSPAKS